MKTLQELNNALARLEASLATANKINYLIHKDKNAEIAVIHAKYKDEVERQDSIIKSTKDNIEKLKQVIRETEIVNKIKEGISN